MAEYTKGKWKVEKDDFGYKIICDTTNPDDTVDIAEIDHYRKDAEAKANTHLIASAPDMYEALRAVRTILFENSSLYQQVDKALLKADGKGGD